MAEPFLGQIITVGFPFAPAGWHLCDGTLMSISNNEALYQLIGTTYGGNGTTNFALPKMNGRVPLQSGQGRGLSTYVQGQITGTEQVTLTSAHTPPHAHTIAFSATPATLENPKSTAQPPVQLAMGANPVTVLKGFYAKPAAGADVPFRAGTITSNTGGGLPHDNRQQYLVLNYIIAIAGIYPSQN